MASLKFDLRHVIHVGDQLVCKVENTAKGMRIQHPTSKFPKEVFSQSHANYAYFITDTEIMNRNNHINSLIISPNYTRLFVINANLQMLVFKNLP